MMQNAWKRKVYSSSGQELKLPHGEITVRNAPNDSIEPVIAPFFNPVYGISINQDGSFGGTPELIHNGTDTAAWTGSAITGTWDFASTDQAHTGTKSICAEDVENGDVAQIANGGLLTDYVAISGWIYITKWSEIFNNHVNVFGYDTTIPAVVGNSVKMEDYFNEDLFNEWQKFVIPLSDMGLTGATIDSIRISVESDVPANKAPDFYLDDIQLEEVGGDIQFGIAPNAGKWMYITNYDIVLADAYDGRLADSTMLALNYNNILGVSTLLNGITLQVIQNEIVTQNITARSLKDILLQPNSELCVSMTDGTDTMIKICYRNVEPLILKSETGDYIRIIVNDDLTGLDIFNVIAGAFEEDAKT